MKIALFIALGFIAGYIVKDLLTKESEVIYYIKKLRAKKGGEVNVEAEATVVKTKTRKEERKENKTKQGLFKSRKNK
jgi:hypothetical protein